MVKLKIYSKQHEYFELGESRTAASQGSMTPNSFKITYHDLLQHPI